MWQKSIAHSRGTETGGDGERMSRESDGREEVEVVGAAEIFMLISSCFACLIKTGKRITHKSAGELKGHFLGRPCCGCSICVLNEGWHEQSEGRGWRNRASWGPEEKMGLLIWEPQVLSSLGSAVPAPAVHEGIKQMHFKDNIYSLERSSIWKGITW